MFTTRPDTMFGATYMVLAPEHPLVDVLVPETWPEGTPPKWTGGAATPFDAVADYLRTAGSLTDVERQVESRQKTGVFTGAYATNPATGASIPVFVADYVLMGYGTGAIMAVPGQDERDWEFAEVFDLPIVRTVQPPDGWEGKAYVGEGPAINSGFLDGLGVADAKRKIIDWLDAERLRRGHGHVPTARLAVQPAALLGRAVPDHLRRHRSADRRARVDAAGRCSRRSTTSVRARSPTTTRHRCPSRRWHVHTTGSRSRSISATARGRYWRETNTMPQWAGSCWYELRYLDPTNENAFVDPAVERYWMGPKEPATRAASTSTSAASSTRCCTCSTPRFWHKVLFDLGHTSSFEPYRRLYNQGYILAAAYQDPRGMYVDAFAVEERDGHYFLGDVEVKREMGKMGKSLKNGISPDDYYTTYGADTLRLYEMFTGPLDQERPGRRATIVGSTASCSGCGD